MSATVTESAEPGLPESRGERHDELDPRVQERRWLILPVLCFALLMIVMDNTILNVAIPSLIRDLDASNSEIQWIIDAYVLVFAGLLLTTGSLSDRLGRKGTLQAGIVLFMLGSAAAALSNSATQLILTRGFMGIGGALIMPSTLSILTNVFRDPKERGRAIATWAGVSGLGVAVGPILGGLLMEHFDWSSVFWINVPLGLVALGAGMVVLPKSRDPHPSRLDPLGAGLSIVGLASLLFGIIEGPAKGWTSTEVTGAFALAAITLTAFVTWERHSDAPMLDMSVFRNARFSAASGTITLTFFALFGSMFLMTQYWQLVHGYTPLQAGVRLLPHALTVMVTAPLSARLVERVGTKRIVATGLSLIALGLALLSTIGPTTSYPVVIGYFVVMAAGMGMTMAPATESVMGSLPRSKAGVGSAVNDTTRQVGGALGVAIIGSVISSLYSDRIANVAARFGLGASDTEHARASLGSAQRVAQSLGERGDAFVAHANTAFVDAMSIGLRISACIILATAVMAWKFLPARATASAHGRSDVTVSPPATVASAAAD